MRTRVLLHLVLSLLMALLLAALVGGSLAPATATATATATAPPPPKGEAFRTTGTWVDVYDYVPAFQTGGRAPAVTPASVDRMAAAGIRTLYLQAATDSVRAPGPVADPGLLGAFLTRAHARGMKVVAWYVPTLRSVDVDMRRLAAMAAFRASGRSFDGLAVDIEWRFGITDVPSRNVALVALSRRLRAATSLPLGAVVLAPVFLEVVNPRFWPSFPWRAIRSSYDVWLPMSYWTDRTTASGYRDPYRYTDENIRRLRADLGDATATVHVVGGVGGRSTVGDYQGFLRAARKGSAVGVSLYDFRVTGPAVWPILTGSRAPGAGR